ncbi:acyltransferase [Bacteroides sp.]|uniref:acyltransferase family protein n=1 Tax=Bacteroides sp. TaxID=29523 RepID=UPI0023C47613|nr:acyltransferase [Bacteroides sp.]MDE6215503.1 acyltransferase [Bacteroides sp.]
MSNKEIISLVIDRLKFPLICGVVFIHNQLKGEISVSGLSVPIPNAPWYEAVINLFSYVIPCIAVPIFFIISGYLFFKEETFNEKLYLTKMKKRFRSLVIPYVLWNTLALFIFIFVRIPALHGLFPNVSLEEVTLPKVLSGYWAREGDGFPFDFPLWYVRELILMVIISPFLYVAVKKMKVCFFISILICMFFSLCPKEFGFTLSACFFFSLGLCARLFPQLIEYVKRLDFIKYLYFPLVVADLYTVTLGSPVNHYIHLLVIFSGILTVLNYVFILKGGKKGCLFKEEIFFIYASHGLFIAFLQKAVLKIIRPITEVEFLVIYFLVPILTITISIGMYRCMKRVTPKVLSILVGGR